MPMQAGTLMVSIRAQDFASRTLRRVSGEFANMSRTQRVAAMGEQARAQQASAMNRKALAESNMRRLNYVRNGMLLREELTKQMVTMEQLAEAERKVFTKGGNLRKARNAEEARMLQSYTRQLNTAGTALRAFGKTQKQVMTEQLAAMDAAMRGPGGRFKTGFTRADIQAYDALKKEIAGLSAEAARTPASFGRLNKAVSAFDARLAGFPSRIRLAATNMRAFGDASYHAKQQLAQAEAALSDSQRAMLNWQRAAANLPAQRLSDFGHAVSGVGRTMQLMGLLGTAVFAATANSFAKFNQQLTLAATQTVGINDDINRVRMNAGRLGQIVVDQMQEFPATANEMSDALYDIFSSMDVTFNGGAMLLRKFNQLAVATMTDLKTATSAGITVLNNFGAATKTSLNENLNLMVAIVRFGRMRLEDFNNMLNKVAPAAASAGQSLKDVAGAMALITTRQPSQRQSATGIARLLQVFQDPDFQQGVLNASQGMVSITKAGGGLKPLPDIINSIASAFKEVATKKGAVQLFRELTAAGRGSGRGTRSTIEAQRAWTFLFKNLQAYNTLQGKTTKDTKEFMRSLKAMSESPGVRWQVFINQMRVLVILIGEAALPVFLKLGDALQRAVRWFRNIDSDTRGLIIRWGSFLAIGLAISGVILGIVGPIIALVAHFKMWSISLEKVGVAAGETAVATARFAFLMKAIPLVGITTLLAHFIGLGRAIKIVGMGFVVWKVLAIAQMMAVATASKIAATEFAIAWRTALSATGWGLFIVAAGLAAEYVMTHWQKVLDFFDYFWYRVQTGFIRMGIQILKVFDFIPGFLGGDKIRNGIKSLEDALHNVGFAPAIRKEAEESNRAMDAFLKKQPKKFQKLRRELQRELKFGDFPAGMNDESVRKALTAMNAAVKRAREGGKDSGADFSAAFMKNLRKTFGPDFSNQLTKLAGQAVEGADGWKQYTDALKDWNAQLQQATQQGAQTAVDNLRSMYTQLEDANKQMMGEMLQGPWLTSETFDLAKEWGITPRVKDVIRDLTMQNNDFAKSLNLVARLRKKGIPTELLDQAKTMPADERNQFLQTLASAKPGQVQAIIQQIKRRNKQIQSQTRLDFKDEIARFRKAGVNMGQAIIDGFQDTLAAKDFNNWVKKQFPDLITAAVNESVRRFREQTPMPTPPTKVKNVKPKPGTRTPPRNTRTPTTSAMDKYKPLPAGTRVGRPGTPLPVTARHSTTDDHSKHVTYNFEFVLPGGGTIGPDHLRKAAFHAKNAVKSTRMP